MIHKIDKSFTVYNYVGTLSLLFISIFLATLMKLSYASYHKQLGYWLFYLLLIVGCLYLIISSRISFVLEGDTLIVQNAFHFRKNKYQLNEIQLELGSVEKVHTGRGPAQRFYPIRIRRLNSEGVSEEILRTISSGSFKMNGLKKWAMKNNIRVFVETDTEN